MFYEYAFWISVIAFFILSSAYIRLDNLYTQLRHKHYETSDWHKEEKRPKNK
jgi:hypothetical protein